MISFFSPKDKRDSITLNLYSIFLLAALLVSSTAKAQLDVQNAPGAGPLGNGALIRFMTGQPTVNIQDNWGLNLTGAENQPVKVYNASLLVGYTSASESYGVGNALINGKVGIGTISPSGKLDIFGNANNVTNLVLSANYNNAYRWRFNTIDRGAAIDLDITASNNIDEQQSILKLSPTYSGRPSLILQDNWLVAKDGKISIGTADAKGYKLAVAGSAIAESMTVQLRAQWPDYVFKKTYQLPSLSSIAEYIAKNSHLPDMPSAKEVEANGVNLGEANRLLLKKVEELTLYILELDKKVTKQSKEISRLKKRK
jgi:hypothetical protein